MLRKISIAVIIIAVFAVCGYFLWHNQNQHTANVNNHNLRIVSLSPSITEMLFALGLADNVVAVTDYCIYPPAAKQKPSIGNLYDHNYELIMTLKPNVVVAGIDQQKSITQLQNLGLSVAVYNNNNIAGIFATLQGVGELTGTLAQANAIVNQMQAQLDGYHRQTAAIPAHMRPRVLVSVGRSMGSGKVSEVYAAGSNTYLGKLIELAGGINVYQGNMSYPVLTTEAIMRLNPDVIIDVVPEIDLHDISTNMVLQQWQGLNDIGAVKNNRVYVLTKGYAVLPGLHLINLLQDFTGYINDGFHKNP